MGEGGRESEGHVAGVVGCKPDATTNDRWARSRLGYHTASPGVWRVAENRRTT